ncbi:MAG TPA: polysaccharide biosynthesis/export family protein [Acidocella sp.]|jgi:polysaccharide export outer membrane protein|uniref:polysaccharide biosynthesis/export family protein n=1 Tax=Acidocella sp. TaxID=50710 RepID=UPI002CB299A9|nr:polysaccharide biosynthesis/export family protein [Acidocella sp.]HVE23434.1 polysaccharide biosynthesis/export family protein [Acidocella sp.]
MTREAKIHRRGVIFGLLGLGGCAVLAPPGTHLPSLPREASGPYRLGAGDTLLIRVYDQPQLSGPFSVNDSGNVDLPLLGSIPAAGLGTGQLASAVARSLQDSHLILHPSVAVEVVSYRPFYILGEVSRPGQYSFRPDMTVLTAVSIAGGFTDRAVESYVGVTRDNGSTPAEYRAPLFALAQPGDVITVFERRF